MADVDFFFDPVCPWAWITSRWVHEVKQLRRYDVNWRFICLKMLNEPRVGTDDSYDEKYQAGHRAGLHALRVADQLRLDEGNRAVESFYTAVGEFIHLEKRRPELVEDPVGTLQNLLKSAHFSPDLAEHALDESHDAYIRSDTDLALARAGKDLGTPILTFHPGADTENSFFGPVIERIPRGETALKLWDSIEFVASMCGMAELKRSLRGRPVFD
jgi:hypothetical protein